MSSFAATTILENDSVVKVTILPPSLIRHKPDSHLPFNYLVESDDFLHWISWHFCRREFLLNQN